MGCCGRSAGSSAPGPREAAIRKCVRHPRDLAWARRILAGEQRAFGAFFDRFVGAVHAFASAREPELRSAEALTERVLATALGEIGRYGGEAPLAAWLLAVARRTARARASTGARDEAIRA